MGEELTALQEQVVKQIKEFGEDSKKNYEELRENHKKLQEIVERNQSDQYDKNFIDKLVEDMSIRQEALDKQSKETLEQAEKKANELQAAFQRLGAPTQHVDEKSAKDLLMFSKSCITNRTDSKVKDAELKGNIVTPEQFAEYERAFVKYIKSPNANALTPEEVKILSVGIDPHGAYTITPQMSNRILQKLFEADPIRRLATVEAITGPYLEWFVDWDEADAGWEGETESGAETSTPDIGMRRVDAFTMYAKPKATQNIIEDAGINIETWIANKVANKFMRKEGAAFVTGDGLKKPRGFLTYATSTTDDEYGKIKQIGMGADADITADGFIDIKYALVEYYLNSASLAWLMQRATVAKVMKLKDGDGAYIWKPGMTADAKSTILGINVEMSPTMPAVAANALSVALSDWSEAYTIVDRLGITVQRDPYTKKPYTEFYTRMRVGGDVVNFQAIKLGKISV